MESVAFRLYLRMACDAGSITGSGTFLWSQELFLIRIVAAIAAAKIQCIRVRFHHRGHTADLPFAVLFNTYSQ